MKKLFAILLVGLIMSAGIAFLWSCGGGGSDTNTYYQDADADGYGDAGVSQELEAPLAGWVLDSTDCDDSDTSVNPASTEVCTDWLDNDCNNDTDCYDLLCAPDPACASCVDSDGDGYYAVDLNCSGGNDCADADSTVNPGVDADGDTVDACQDCDDADSTTGTGTTEVCNDFDDDCDTVIDEDWITGGTVTYTDLDGTSGLVKGDACGTGACAGGAVVCAPDETNLTCTTAGLASTEVCDGLDNDCDGTVDEGDPCDDGLFCTIDVCNGAGGCSYIDRTCADSVDCTVDICDEESDICSSQPDDAFCLPAGQCYYAVCDVQIGCTDILKPRGATCDGMSTEEVCSWSCDGSGTCVEGALADAGEPCVNNGICNGDGRCLYGNGYPCASDGDCQSGNCVDNVCCDTACNGICESCINAAFIGICTYIQEGTDPDNECSGAETCDGAGECAP